MKQIFNNLLGRLIIALIAFSSVILLNNLAPTNIAWLTGRLHHTLIMSAIASDPSTTLFSTSLLPLAAQGAQIDETLVTKAIYVDNTIGLLPSLELGSQAQPFTSIQQALDAAKVDILAGTGVRVVIQPGVYREELYLEGNGLNNAPLIIEAGAPALGQVIISGADVFTGWQAAQDMPGAYQHPWLYRWGTIENPWRKQFGQGKEAAYPDFRREMFYLDGKPLSQSLSQTALHPGSFFIDEAAGRVLLYPPTGININATLIESAMRSANQDFGVLKIYKLNNLILRNLTITQGSVAVWGSTRISGNNILVENCHFDRNNGVGLSINGEKITIRRTTANENGHAGMFLEGTSMLVEQSEASWNGWKMKEWGYEDCSGAGIKFGGSSNVLVRSVKLVGNSYPGLWFDEGCTTVTVDNVLAFAGVSSGLNWEISDQLQISNLYSLYNQVGWVSFDGSRVNLQTSVLAFNRSLQMLTSNTDRPYDTELWTVSGTTIAADTGNQYLLWDIWPQPASAAGVNTTMDKFAATFTASNNVYSQPSFSVGFRKGDGSPLSLSQWQSYTGQEVGSVWDGDRVRVTMASLKASIQTQWGNPTVQGLGYHDHPLLPW